MDFIIFKYEVGALVGTNDSYPVIVMYVNIGHSHMMCSSPAVYGIIDVVIEFAIFNNNVVCVAGVKASPIVMEFTVARNSEVMGRPTSIQVKASFADRVIAKIG